MCCNGTTIFYIKRQYTSKHVMLVKGFIVNQIYKVLSSHIVDATPLMYIHQNKRKYTFHKNY
jgi:hypothetical protein